MKRSTLFPAIAIAMVIPFTAFVYASATTAKSTTTKTAAEKTTATKTSAPKSTTSARSSTGVMHQHRHATTKIDLNTASKEELMRLHGVDAATADKIIASRPFKTKGDLVSRNIVSKQEYQKIASTVVVKPENAEGTKK